MKKVIFFTLFFWVGLVSLPGCLNNCTDCPDQNTVSKYADIVGLGSFINKQITTNSEPRTVKANDRLRWDNITFFSIIYDIRTYGMRVRRPRPSWGTSAYACDCIQPGYLGSEEKLVNLTVKTVYNFDSSHSAGSVINDITSIYRYLNNQSLNDYLLQMPIPYSTSSRIDLVIDRTPSAKGPFALDVTVELDNGEVYTTRTPVIELI